MKRKLKNLSFLTLAIVALGLSSIAYANEEQEYYPINSGGGGMTVIPIEMHIPSFENPVDQMYYNVFGEGFELMQQRSRQVNRVIYQDGIKMEIFSTITVRKNLFDDERGQTNTSFTFFTLQDQTENRVSSDMQLNLNTDDLQDHTRPVWAHERLIDFDEDTQTATFVVEHRFWSIHEENNSIHEHVNLVIEGIVKDRVYVDEILKDIDIAYLVNSHTPTLEENNTSLETINDDFPIEERKSLVRDELEIPIEGWESAYISNIALKDNMLHIQTNTHRAFDIDRSSIDWWTSYSINNLINTNTGEFIWPIDTLRIDNFDEEGNFIDNRQYEEFIFYIEDLDSLPYYYINLNGGYFETIIDTNLEVSFYSPVIKENIIIEEVKILIGGEEVYINSIQISPLEIRLGIEPHGIELNNYDLHYFINDNVNLTLIFEDGTDQENIQKRWGHNSWGMNWSWVEDDTNDIIITEASMVLRGLVINVEELAAVNINGTVIEVK